jgi:hypothetical protein
MFTKPEIGPFRPEQVRPGDRYEVNDGHAVYCAPTGGEGSVRVGLAYAVLASDPKVEQMGIDAGYRVSDLALRAPDLAIGNVPTVPGWIPGAPTLAVELAGVGQDEVELAAKIRQFLAAGTRFIWVVRLARRCVEVHEPNQEPRTAGLDATLTAPGVLENAVPVRAFFDGALSQQIELRNLLQRHGFEDLQAVLARGREDGHKAGREEAERGIVRRMSERGLSAEQIAEHTGLALPFVVASLTG